MIVKLAYLIARPWFPYAAALLGALIGAGYVYAQTPPAGSPETQTVVRPTATIIQVEALALVAGLGTGLGSIGVGIRSAAKIITDYLTKRDLQEAAAKKADQDHTLAVAAILKGVTDGYHADRGACTGRLDKIVDRLDGICETLEDIEAVLPAVKERRARRGSVMGNITTSPPAPPRARGEGG